MKFSPSIGAIPFYLFFCSPEVVECPGVHYEFSQTKARRDQNGQVLLFQSLLHNATVKVQTTPSEYTTPSLQHREDQWIRRRYFDRICCVKTT